MTATENRPVTTLTSAANECTRRALNTALAAVFRLDTRASVVAVAIDGERPVLTLDRQLAIAGSHHITRNVDGRRAVVWVADDYGCRLECEAPQTLPQTVGGRR